MMRGSFLIGAIVVGVLAACGALPVAVDSDTADVEAGVPSDDASTTPDLDATLPQPNDSALDAHAHPDSTVDAAVDASVDASLDAGPDAVSLDAGPDAASLDAGPDTVSSFVVGRWQTCFVMSSGRLYCVGDGVLVPTVVPGITDAVEVTIGGGNGTTEAHTCVRRAGGTVDCWGNNSDGQLGDGTTTARATPTPVVGLSNAVQISAGNEASTCARQTAGTVVCWGQNTYGNLGDGTTIQRTTPNPLSGLADAIDLSVGGFGGCALRVGGQVVCWGANSRGQLGDGRFDHGKCSGIAGTNDCSSVPVLVTGLADAVAISRGSGNGYAIRADGTVWSWGSSRSGALGDGLTTHPKICPHPNNNDCMPTPGAVVSLAAATRISAGSGGACALHPSGAVSCWGDDFSGELGNGAPQTDSNVPVGVSGVADAMSINRRASSACVMRPAGRISCWGRNHYGNLGNGTMSNVTSAPVDVVW